MRYYNRNVVDILLTWIASERKSESSKYIIFGENEYENGSLGLCILKHSEVTKEGQKAWGRKLKSWIKFEINRLSTLE